MSTLVRSGIALTIAIGVANVLNAAFQFSLARILEPDEYALLAALFAVVIVAAIPPLAFQATAAREVSARLAQNDVEGAGAFLKSMALAVGRWSWALIAAGLGIALLALVLDASDPTAYGATAITIGVALLIPVMWGGLQGAGRFGALSGAHVLLAGTRLCAGVVVGLAGGGVGAVMVGVVVATMVTELVSLLPLRPVLRGAEATRERLFTRVNAGAALGLTALWTLMYADLIIARIVLDGEEAGAYAAAAVASKVLLLVPIAATTVLFPRVAVLQDRARERKHLLAGLAVVAAASAVLTAFAWLLAGPLVDGLFGSEYAAAESWLGPLCLAMALYGLAMVYLYHFLAVGAARVAVVLLVLVAAQAVGYVLLHDEPRDLVAVQIVFGALAVVACETWYHLRRN